MRHILNSRRIRGVHFMRGFRHVVRIAPGQNRRPVNGKGLAGENIVMPGVQADFKDVRIAVVSVPKGLCERCGNGIERSQFASDCGSLAA